MRTSIARRLAALSAVLSVSLSGLVVATNAAAGMRETAAATESLAKSVDSRFTDGYADVGDVRLHYVSGGEGPPVLLAPGWLQTWYAWRSEMPALANAGFHVVAVDLRGMGQSSHPVSGYDTGQLALDLNDLMHQLGYSRYAMAGHDVGMWVAYALAADHPESVERVALIEGGITGLIKPEPQVFMPQAQSAFFWQFMFNQQPDLPEMLLQGRERVFMSYLFDKWAFHPERIALSEYVEAYSVPGGIRAQMAYYRAFPETNAQNVRRSQHKLTMPVLALGGDHGVRDIPLEMLRPVATQVRGGVLQHCGHFAPEECPEELLGQLLPFLRESRHP